MSEALEILGFIGRGGCLLTDLAAELCIPVDSVHRWVDMLCSTGYLKQCGQENGACPCASTGAGCNLCRCSCQAIQAGRSVRIEVTERGKAMIQRRSYETGSGLYPEDQILSSNGMAIEENGVAGEGARFEVRVPAPLFRFADASAPDEEVPVMNATKGTLW